MAYKIVGADDASQFPPRVSSRLALDDRLRADANNVAGYLRAQAARRNAEPVVVVVAGHSVVAGSTTTDPSRRFVNLFSDELQAAFPRAANGEAEVRTLAQAVSSAPTGTGIHVINAGVSGSQSHNYLTSTTRPQVMSLKPAIVIHSDLPANDVAAGVSAERVKANLVAQMSALDALATEPVLHVFATAYLRATAGSASTAEEYRRAIYEMGERPNVAVLSEYETWRRIGAESTDVLDYMAPDGFHPNDRGHAAASAALAYGFGLVTAPPVQPMTTRLTSDRFSGSGNIVGRTADAGLGGAAATWTGQPANLFTVGSGRITRQGTSSGAAILPIPDNADIHVSAILESNPAHKFAMLDLYRAASGSAFQFGVDEGGRVCIRSSSPTIYRKLDLTPAQIIGQRLGLRYYRGVLSAFVNGLIVATATPPADTVSRVGAGAGVTVVPTSTACAWSELAVDILS